MPESATEPVLVLTSFGFLHLPKDATGRPVPPPADRIEDVRDRLRDPAAPGCAGGKHRAAGITELLARELRACGRRVDVEHLHVHLPRVLKTPANGTAHASSTQEATR
ncbi:hypothetical protein [Streptomyces europaeiscabiei]|uniref:hypothetical protein n=1 Tax=Streptomyces europaeiscabiei TaxID=146819 RepID=UPI0029B52323|nr:hypothetical protein [Streptomyces europaeiscabiei]MDX3587595.1 hypothetical protein [Streptomyces europaeiscabiei]